MSVSTESILDTTQAVNRGKRLGCTTTMARPNVASISGATCDKPRDTVQVNHIEDFPAIHEPRQMKSFQLRMPAMLLAPTATQTKN